MTSTFTPANLEKFGMAYILLAKLMRTFELSTYADATDPFNPIQKFTDEWNKNIILNLVSGQIISVYESMGLWKDKGKLGCIFSIESLLLLRVARAIRPPIATRGLLFSWSPTRRGQERRLRTFCRGLLKLCQGIAVCESLAWLRSLRYSRLRLRIL